MKANEAPEKIYMTPSFGEPNNVLLASFSKSHLNFHRDIEYTRTDVFIEKACEWLNKELPITDLSPSNMLDITFKVFNEEHKRIFIEDFKNYMKRK